MIHHGAASPPREIERMIAAMRHLDERFELDFLLVPGSKDYISQLGGNGAARSEDSLPAAGADARVGPLLQRV